MSIDPNARISQIISAEGIKGNASRIAVATKLAVASPDMAASDVVAFVTDHIHATAAMPLSARYKAMVARGDNGPIDGPSAGRLTRLATRTAHTKQ